MKRATAVLLAAACLMMLVAGEFPKTLNAFPGTTPKIDGVLSKGEWDDATTFTGVSEWIAQRLHRFMGTGTGHQIGFRAGLTQAKAQSRHIVHQAPIGRFQHRRQRPPSKLILRPSLDRPEAGRDSGLGRK